MAIKLKDLKFDVVASMQGEILLVDEPRVYETYEEGVKKGPGGIAYTCLCAGLNFEKQVIKIPGILTPQVEYNGTPLRVAFEGLEGKVWQDFSNHGEIKLSVTAKEIVAVTDKPHLKMNMGGKV